MKSWIMVLSDLLKELYCSVFDRLSFMNIFPSIVILLRLIVSWTAVQLGVMLHRTIFILMTFKSVLINFFHLLPPIDL